MLSQGDITQKALPTKIYKIVKHGGKVKVNNLLRHYLEHYLELLDFVRGEY